MSVQMREIEEVLFTEQGLTETQVGKQSEVIQRGQLAGGMLVLYDYDRRTVGLCRGRGTDPGVGFSCR